MGSCHRRFVVLGVVLVASVTQATLEARPDGQAVPIAALRRQGPDADVGPDTLVVIRGRVAWCVDTEEDGSYAVVQDDTAGIWVNVRLARTRGLWNPTANSAVEADWQALQPGLEVAVTGRRDTSGYAPMILPTAIRIPDRDAPRVMPEAIPTTAIRLFAGADDSQRVAFTGVLQGYRRQGDAWVLAMGSEGRRFLAHLPADFMPDGPGPFVDGVVRITGVATSKFTTRGEIMTPFLRVARREDLELVEPPPASSDPGRVVPLDRLVGFNPNGPDEHRVRTQGVVTHALPGRMLFVQQGASGVRVETTSPDLFLPGDVVEIVGFVDTSRVLAGIAQAAAIREAVVQRIGHEPPPAPIPVQPDEIIETNAKAAALGLTAIPGDYDGALVTFTARLSELHRAERGGVLLLSTGRTLLGGLASSVDYASLSKLEVGSQLQVAGVLQLQVGSDELENLEWGVPEVGRMSIVLRSMNDVKVLEQPPWWTRRRLVNALAAVAVALGTVLGWAALLRRQVAVQSRTLALEISDRHAAAVEYAATLRERNRLAANLHDTLLQSLSAIGIQLQSCELAEREDAVAREQQLGVARGMVDHAVAELRGSVWSLRTYPLKGKSFAEAVEALAGQLAAAAGIRVIVDRGPDVPPIPDGIAGNLLLVLQEAMNNAARHARPQQIIVSVRRGPAVDRLEVAVADDGQGFDEHAAAGPAEGHFGLHVMRERVERLGGWLELTSRPGHGTEVCAHLRLPRASDVSPDPSSSP